MKSRRVDATLSLWFAWIGIILCFMGSMIGGQRGIIVSLFGAVVAFIFTSRQFVEGKPFVTLVLKSEWARRAQGDWAFLIPQVRHRKGVSPKVSVLLLEHDGIYKSAVGDYEVLPNGDVRVVGEMAFDRMKVVIR